MARTRAPARPSAPPRSRLRCIPPPNAPPVTVVSPRDGQLGIFTGEMSTGERTHYFHESLLAEYGPRCGVTDRGSVLCPKQEDGDDAPCRLCQDLTLPRAIRKTQLAYYVPGLVHADEDGWRWAVIAVPGASANTGAFTRPGTAPRCPRDLLAGLAVVFVRANRTRNGVLTFRRLGRQPHLVLPFPVGPVLEGRFGYAGPELVALRRSLPWPESLKLPVTADALDARPKREAVADPVTAQTSGPEILVKTKLAETFLAGKPLVPQSAVDQSRAINDMLRVIGTGVDDCAPPAPDKARQAEEAGRAAYAGGHGRPAADELAGKVFPASQLPAPGERGAA